MDVKEYNKHKDAFKEYYTDLEKAVKVLQEKYSPGYDDGTKIESFDFDAEIVHVQYERHPNCGCCGSDYDGDELPIDIATPEGLERYIKERDEEIKRYKENEKARKRREERQKKIAAEEARRKTYEELKAEFDD